jgi:hypothetical protein
MALDSYISRMFQDEPRFCMNLQSDTPRDRPPESSPSAPATSDDVALLHKMGYAQELLRRMSGFSNFAISFSIICILAGGITSLQLGISAVGGAAAGIVWPVGVIFSLSSPFAWLTSLPHSQLPAAFTIGALFSAEKVGVGPLHG